MKRIYLLNILLLLILITSCSDNTTNSSLAESKEKRQVTFKIDNIIVTQTRNSANLSSQIQHLEYWVYNTIDIENINATPLLHNIVNSEDIDKDITFSIEKGSYTIVFYGADKILENTNNTSASKVIVPDMNTQLFSTKMPFTIKEKDVVIEEKVTLERKVGKVEIIIEDLKNLPEEVKAITPIFEGHYALMGQRVFPVAPYSLDILGNFSNQFRKANADQYLNLTIPRNKFNTINSDNPITFYIIDTNVGTGSGAIESDILYLLGSKSEKPSKFEDVIGDNSDTYFIRLVKKGFSIEPNDVIRYSGKIGKLGDNSWNINLDDAWNETEVEIVKE